jgi:hypothetical protein
MVLRETGSCVRKHVLWHVHLNVNPAWVCKTQAGLPHFYVNVFFSGFDINNIFIYMRSHLKISVPAVQI